MSALANRKKIAGLFERQNLCSGISAVFLCCFTLCCLANLRQIANAQGTEVTGGFYGYVKDKATGTPVAGAVVQFTNEASGAQYAAKTDLRGYFIRGNLLPGVYLVNVSLPGYLRQEIPPQRLFATRGNPFQPIADVLLEKESPVPTSTPTPKPVIIADLPPESEGNVLSPRRGAFFTERVINALPLGGSTLTRTFDELALLVPGVAPPPQTGNTAGPGVGPGVGTSGQFAVNGLRSRANNFTVDGSDNNDEDIGVRRQGFFTLVPQPAESIQEFGIITLLAPAQYGRNASAQVNAISRSGGNDFRGSIFALFNSDRLNARNFFDNANGNQTINLTARRSDGSPIPVFVDGRQLTATNSAGSEDELNLFQGGFVFGGPIVRNKMFFFVSAEGQTLNATKETHFAVPTIEQRGLFNSGAQGLTTLSGTRVYPTSVGGDAVFSLFPFPNDPNGVFGRNTYTRELSADGRGRIISGKFDHDFSVRGRPQIFTARYNYTDDWRDLPSVGGAIFSAVRPLVRTDNFSTYLTGDLANGMSNVLRFSWGRSRLRFDELKDGSGFLLPVNRQFNNPANARFLLNARLFFNNTLPGAPITGCTAATVCYSSASSTTENSSLGLIGQLIVAGFSPVGVDVFNFPQQRVNNTFQFADTLNWQVGAHNLTFGADIRRSFSRSELPRNSRPLVTFYGGPNPNNVCAGRFCTPQDLAAAGAATGFFQTLVLPGRDARINLRFNQLNFFAQDEWRAFPNLTISYGLRYEYNTPPEEADRKIEATFGQTLPAMASDFNRFVGGRTRIFEPDRNNFAPRLGFAAAITPKTVVRAGFGIFHDQIIGAVVSQSRNVFPTFTTLNFGGGLPVCYIMSGTPPAPSPVPCHPANANIFGRDLFFNLFNPINSGIGNVPVIQNGTLNTLNPAFIASNSPTNDFLRLIYYNFPAGAGTPFGATLPARELETPTSYHYSIGIERELFSDTFLSLAYVRTTGRNLLRFTTPNLGSNYIAAIGSIMASSNQPVVRGGTFDPAGRIVPGIGPITQFETTGRSRYDSLQVELRGRLSNSFQYQTSYTLGSVNDDVSDVFDLAGAPALPQNSRTFEGEYAPANFDVRHRFTYSFIYDLPRLRDRSGAVRALFGGWQIASTGKYNSGQPFTVNSIFDVNLDGNLTDRLDNTSFIAITNNRRQPLRLNAENAARLQQMLAPPGADGSVRRNSFRAADTLELDLSFSKRFSITERRNLRFRADIINFINRANFAIPVRFLEAPAFGQATDTVTPGRRIQLGLYFSF